ncbi:type II toxin-antitoxin system VapC family toxin [soil metagenome]
MRILLDTHVLLWAAAAPDRLGSSRRDIVNAERRLLSAASTWELAIKQGLGKLDLGTSVRSWVDTAVKELQLDQLSITGQHAAAVEQLPPLHRDPFDRLLIAQARSEGALLLTADRGLLGYGDVVRLVGGDRPG